MDSKNFFSYVAETDKLTFLGFCKNSEIANVHCSILEDLYGVKPLNFENPNLQSYFIINQGTPEVLFGQLNFISKSFTADTLSKLPYIKEQVNLVFTGQKDYYVYMDGKKEDVSEHIQAMQKLALQIDCS
jgi:hypothetical protein